MLLGERQAPHWLHTHFVAHTKPQSKALGGQHVTALRAAAHLGLASWIALGREESGTRINFRQWQGSKATRVGG